MKIMRKSMVEAEDSLGARFSSSRLHLAQILQEDRFQWLKKSQPT